MKYIKKFENLEDTGVDLLQAILRENLSKIKKLIKAGAELNFQDAYGDTPLFLAIHQGNIEIAEILIKAGANINILENYGNTPLILSADSGYLDMVEILIDAGADWNFKNSNGCYFYDYLDAEGLNMLKTKYPDKYEEHKINIDAKKYNL